MRGGGGGGGRRGGYEASLGKINSKKHKSHLFNAMQPATVAGEGRYIRRDEAADLDSIPAMPELGNFWFHNKILVLPSE